MAYIEKCSLVIGDTSEQFAYAKSTAAYTGYIAGVYYTIHGTDPMNTSSSSFVRLRSSSTSGFILMESSSGFGPAASQWFFPGGPMVDWSTFTGSVSTAMMTRIPLQREHLVLTRASKAAGAGKGSTEKLTMTVYVDGIQY